VEKSAEFSPNAALFFRRRHLRRGFPPTQFRPHGKPTLGIPRCLPRRDTLSTTAPQLKIIAMTTLQKTLVVATVTILIGAGAYEALLISRLRDQNNPPPAAGPLAGQIQHYNAKRRSREPAGQTDDQVQKVKGLAELLKLRSEVGCCESKRFDPIEPARFPADNGGFDERIL